jgi:hypothetical protein
VVIGKAALDRGALATLPRVRAVWRGGSERCCGCESTRRAGLRRFGGAGYSDPDGCDEHCTFCATTLPAAPIARAVAETVAEAYALARHHAELVLTGVHIGT